MATKPSLDDIFGTNSTKPSLDNIFGENLLQGVNPITTPVAQAYQQQVGQIPVAPGAGYGMNTINSVNANSMLGPDANKAAINANIDLQKQSLQIPLEAQKEFLTSQAKAQVSNQTAYDDSLSNLQKALGMFQNQSAAYREGINQGVAGDRAKYMAGAFKSWLGGDIGDSASATGRIQSASRDTMFMMAPIITQSRRFMASVQAALMKTMPQGWEGPKTARDKLQQDAWNLYRITRTDAFKNLTPEEVKSFDSNPNMADKKTKEMIKQALSYQPSKDELLKANELIKGSTLPLNDLAKDNKSILERDYPQYFDKTVDIEDVLKGLGNGN